jgi:hypothetical protein
MPGRLVRLFSFFFQVRPTLFLAVADIWLQCSASAQVQNPGRRPADATAALVRHGICAEHVSGRDRVRAAEPPCPRVEPRRAGAGPSHRQT